jgi:hypothetical protein
VTDPFPSDPSSPVDDRGGAPDVRPYPARGGARRRRAGGEGGSAAGGRGRDRRAEERAILVQIAASALRSHLLRRGCSSGDGGAAVVASSGVDEVAREFHRSHPGAPDLIAVLLVQLGSPSLASLVLARLLGMGNKTARMDRLCVRRRDDGYDAAPDDDDGGSFASCVDDDEDDDGTRGGPDDDSETTTWSALATGCYLPMLRMFDGEVHASLLCRMAREDDADDDHRLSSSSPTAASRLGRTIHRWSSSWFCSEGAALPMSVAARVVDFLIASHPAMPL